MNFFCFITCLFVKVNITCYLFDFTQKGLSCDRTALDISARDTPVSLMQHLKSLTDLFAQTPPEKQVRYVAFKSHSVSKVGNGFLISKRFAKILNIFSTSAGKRSGMYTSLRPACRQRGRAPISGNWKSREVTLHQALRLRREAPWH